MPSLSAAPLSALALPDLSPLAWAAVLLAAALAGIAKTALPGAATIAVALCAAVLPAKESTGAMLLMLMTGDVLAVWSYRRDADVRMLLRLVPAVLTGVVAGAVFLRLASNDSTRRVIGAVLLVLIAVTLVQRRRQHAPAPSASGSEGSNGPKDPYPSSESPKDPSPSPEGAYASGGSASAPGGPEPPSGANDPGGPATPGPLTSPPTTATPGLAASRTARLVYGSLASFTTMVANAGGPVTSMYFLACRYPVKAFLGTTAWFFFVVNLVKLPFSVSIGLVNPTTLSLAALAAPVVVVVAILGRRLAEHMDQQVFDPVVIGLTVVSSLPLLL